MVDIVDSATRSRMMRGIRGKDTKPEVQLRKALFARGFRYRLHVSSLPGSPDIVLPKYRAAIFVHGCFWHGHDCHLFRLPATRTEFWRDKIEGNRQRDSRTLLELQAASWRVLTVWECAMKGKTRLACDELVQRVSVWITGNSVRKEIAGSV
ncbi:DNA mismatch endonuclease Vsr [Labrenzia sp. 011]|uniref:very short patch repair endonuclease n=1 Tax=Labrenzia sp. 011 TaxID=2171494 RepID=UPI000D517EE0|nr:DNA mismatch endonuclease Vsr [Labrenzia sp. 011]PVB59840.1 very short patch repair endonuclease [Labrenzia sp. 011]